MIKKIDMNQAKAIIRDRNTMHVNKIEDSAIEDSAIEDSAIEDISIEDNSLSQSGMIDLPINMRESL